MTDIDKMSFEELLKWSRSVDWDTVTNEQWRVWRDEAMRLAPAHFQPMDLTQLEAFYREHSGEDLEPWFEAWSDAMRDVFPLSEINDRLRAIETTLVVLLKKFGDQPADITVGQLNRLKGGL